MVNKLIFEEKNGDLLVRLKILPGSSKNEFVVGDEILKVKISAPAVDNKANKALIDFLSKKLRTAKSNISILKGELNREKLLLIKGFSEDVFLEKIKIS